EYITEERKAEAAAVAAARERGRAFAQQMEKYRHQAQLQGMEFLGSDHKIHFKTFNYNDQIAVLVGGFKTDEDARKALGKVRGWPMPKAKVRSSRDPSKREYPVMDVGTIFRPGPDGKQLLQESFVNPYATATVVPNPAVQRADQAAGTQIDPLILQLNSG